MELEDEKGCYLKRHERFELLTKQTYKLMETSQISRKKKPVSVQRYYYLILTLVSLDQDNENRNENGRVYNNN